MPIHTVYTINVSIECLFLNEYLLLPLFFDIQNYTFFISESTNHFGLGWAKADIEYPIDFGLNPFVLNVIVI